MPYFGRVLCFKGNTSFTFQAVKNLSAHSTIYVLGCAGDFWVHLEINSFSERISKIYGNRKF